MAFTRIGRSSAASDRASDATAALAAFIIAYPPARGGENAAMLEVNVIDPLGAIRFEAARAT